MADITVQGEGVGSFEKRADAGKVQGGTYRYWMNAISLSEKTEKDWRKAALDVNERYRDEKDRSGARFNILYSSVQTQPAMYNSTPEPDVRRRFNDDDPVGKVAAEVFERTLSHCVDEYDFDVEMNSVVHDSLTVGRGTALVVYEPMTDDTGEVAYEGVKLEHVDWEDVRVGPAKTWDDIPWIAVRYRITREDAIARDPKEGPEVTLDYIEECDDKDRESTTVPDSFKRLTVWKIWDKTRREIIFIAPPHNKGPFAVEKDDLGLEDFLPFPRPLYDVVDPNSLVPLIPYNQYKDQAEELDRITRRIHALVNALRWRGVRPASIPELDQLHDAEDGELIPSESFDALMMQSGANADHAIWLMPIDRLITVIRELVIQREQIKQVVFEISGLADIMRGETDPNETLGAQQIKAQWGSLRMQKRQREVQRFCRDVMRIKAEIIGEHFDIQTLGLVSGMKLMTAEQKQQAQMLIQTNPQQAQQIAQAQPELAEMFEQPTWEEVKAVMGSDQMRSYRVDIETDSTIQADLTRAQQNMSTFVQGLASFTEAVGPAVQGGFMKMDVVTDLLVSFARNFKLGRKAEDALERMGEEASKQKGPSEAEQAQLQQQQAEMQAQQAVEMEKQKTEQAKAIEAAKKGEAEAANAQRQQQEDQLKAEKDAADIMERDADRQFNAEKREFEREKMIVEAKKAEVEMARLTVEGQSLSLETEDHEINQEALSAFVEAIKVMSESNAQTSEAMTAAVESLANAANLMAEASMSPRIASITTDGAGNKIAKSEVVLQ